jgi:hypothetical protein
MLGMWWQFNYQTLTFSQNPESETNGLAARFTTITVSNNRNGVFIIFTQPEHFAFHKMSIALCYTVRQAARSERARDTGLTCKEQNARNY